MQTRRVRLYIHFTWAGSLLWMGCCHEAGCGMRLGSARSMFRTLTAADDVDANRKCRLGARYHYFTSAPGVDRYNIVRLFGYIYMGVRSRLSGPGLGLGIFGSALISLQVQLQMSHELFARHIDNCNCGFLFGLKINPNFWHEISGEKYGLCKSQMLTFCGIPSNDANPTLISGAPVRFQLLGEYANLLPPLNR